ncbi:MAG: hypothetical protein M3144_01250, partial [Actinomycetota bacterium]|nr:hypothetical protein [Actinomycetota bacterium]
LPACSPDSSDESIPRRTTPPTTGTRSSSPLRTAAGDQALVQSLGVQQEDVENGYAVVPITDGDKVEGSVTLDLCSARFPSEQLRVARRQVAVADAQLQTWLSTEAVLYESPAATDQVFAELREAQARCPSTFVAPPNSDVVPLKTVFNPPPDGRWPQTPGVDRLAFDLGLSDQEGRTLRTVAVYLRRGRVLLGVYFPRPEQRQLDVNGRTTIESIVAGFAQRLSRLPASAVS